MIYLKLRMLVAALIFIIISINSLRYFFKFGAPSSSPGYGETPIEFWVIRYMLVGLILLIFMSSWKRFKIIESIAFGVLVFSSTYALMTTESALIKIAAFHLCVAGFLFLAVRSMKDEVIAGYVGHFTKLLYVLVVLFSVFLVLQIFLYFAFDRLPSHSHINSILVRFGSVLDDSLAFGLLLPMFAGLIFYSLEDEFLKFISLMVVILIAILTGSLTAMATTTIFTLWLVRLRWRNFVLWFLLISMLFVSFHWYFIELWSAKSGSIAGHLDGLQLLTGNTEAKIFSGNTEAKIFSGNTKAKIFSGNTEANIQSGGFAESGWILLLKNFGIFAPLVILGFHLYIHLLCLRMLRLVYDYKQFIGSVLGLNFSALVASFNLPVLMIFPTYFLLAIFSAVLCGLAGKLGIGLKLGKA